MNDDGRPVISGFSLSRFVGEAQYEMVGGAVRYMAPEFFGLEDLDDSHEAKSSDVYSFAMVGVEVRRIHPGSVPCISNESAFPSDPYRKTTIPLCPLGHCCHVAQGQRFRLADKL